MKKIKRLFSWILVSLVLQFTILIYLNNYYYAPSSGFKVKKVTSTTVKVKRANVTISDDIEKAQISFTGTYFTYISGTELKIINTENGAVKSLDLTQGASLAFYKLLPDRNLMIVAEKVLGVKGASFKLYNYDLKTGVKQEIMQNGKVPIVIKAVDKKADIEDIQFSTVMQVIYVKVHQPMQKSNIYRFDIMADMSKTQISGYYIGNIRILATEDKLIYEDLSSRRIKTSSGGAITFKQVSNPGLLGTDGDNNVYIGDVKDNKVSKVYYGSLKDNFSSWKYKDLPSPAAKSDIQVMLNGKVYINDGLSGTITELISNKKTSYKGVYYAVYNSGIVSVDNGKLIITAFK